MTAIKHTLQREVFLPAEERLIAVVHVTKAGKKKKSSFLCAAVTTEKPIQAQIYQVKKADRGDGFKKKLSWPLRQLKVWDGKDANKDTAEFEMQFDKSYKWVASSITEKYAFIQCLWKLSQRYLVQKPEFLNVPSSLLEDATQKTEVDKSVQQAEEIAMAQDTEFHALSPKEESDIGTLMSKCEFSISNAEAFADQLSKDLSVLDGANVHSIMGSEDQVMELMVLIDKALQEAMKMEEKMDYYEQKLQGVKDLMEIMKDKDMLIQVRNRNHQKLQEELDGMVTQLDVEHKHMKALLDGDLSAPIGISECSAAAHALLRAMSAEIHPSLEKMAAVQEQRRRFKKLKATFATRLAHYMNNLFIHQGNELGETLSRYSGELKLPRHTSCHRDMLPYADLMLWLEQVDLDSFNKLTNVYTASLSKLYDREVRDFIESARQNLGVARLDRRGTLPGARVAQGGSSSSLNRSVDSRSHRSGSIKSVDTLDSDSHHGSDTDVTGRSKFDQMFEHVLSELGPVCLAEQDFCIRFFHLSVEDGNKEAKPGEAGEQEEPWVHQKAMTPKQRKINEEARKMMLGLFPSLETELDSFISFGDRLDSFNSLYMLVRMTQHVASAEDTGSFLSKTFGNCLIKIKRNFDRFKKDQIQAIQEFRIPKKTKIGIISFVHSFENFAHHAESIFRGSDRRTDLDKAYITLVYHIYEEIMRVASESQKTPPDVVKFENFHHMHAVLSRLKIQCLDVQRRDAKQKYQEHLQSYVISCLGRPMEKLHNFFDGIEARVAAGVKLEEVGYQLAYSKQELRKVIKEYTAKEVKKGLDHLYKKVEKQLCGEENLLQVAWHYMQDEFIKQYKYFEQMITKCYPGSGITIEFTINDVLSFFSDIAQSH